MNYKDIVCNPNVVSPIVFSGSSCLKPKVASIIVSVTFIVLSYEIYAHFMVTVDRYGNCRFVKNMISAIYL